MLIVFSLNILKGVLCKTVKAKIKSHKLINEAYAKSIGCR